MRHARHVRTLILVAALALVAAACGGDGASDAGGGGGEGSLAQYDLSGQSYAVGSKDFTEQLVLGHMSRLALEEAGASVDDRVGLAGTAAARQALTSGEIDLYWEYNGTGWGVHLGNELGPDALPENLTEEVAQRDLEQNDIRWLEAAPFNNTYALAVRTEVAGDVPMKISEIPSLIEEDPSEASLCIESEFSTREDSLPGLEDFYGFDWPDGVISIVDTGVVYTQTDQGECTYGEVFTSDGRIAALDLEIVEDDKNFFPPYNPSVTIRNEKYEDAPQVGDLFADIADSLDLETMQELNARVDVDGEFPEDVARSFLEENGFIG